MKQLQSTFDFVYIMVKIFILNGQLYWKTINVILVLTIACLTSGYMTMTTVSLLGCVLG